MDVWHEHKVVGSHHDASTMWHFANGAFQLADGDPRKAVPADLANPAGEGDRVIIDAADGKVHHYPAGSWHAIGNVVCGWVTPDPNCPNCFPKPSTK